MCTMVLTSCALRASLLLRKLKHPSNLCWRYDIYRKSSLINFFLLLLPSLLSLRIFILILLHPFQTLKFPLFSLPSPPSPSPSLFSCVLSSPLIRFLHYTSHHFLLLILMKILQHNMAWHTGAQTSLSTHHASSFPYCRVHGEERRERTPPRHVQQAVPRHGTDAYRMCTVLCYYFSVMLNFWSCNSFSTVINFLIFSLFFFYPFYSLSFFLFLWRLSLLPFLFFLLPILFLIFILIFIFRFATSLINSLRRKLKNVCLSVEMILKAWHDLWLGM